MANHCRSATGSTSDNTAVGTNFEVILPQMEVVDEGGGIGSLVIRMSSDANEWVIADAVIVQYVGPPGSPLRASELSPENRSTGELPAADLAAALLDVKMFWAASGLSAADAARLDAVQVQVAPLPNTLLGWAAEDGSSIWIDTDAAGHGWKVSQGSRVKSGGPDVGGMDLLTVLAHELGHVMGRQHGADHDVMAATLAAGVQALPGQSFDVGGEGLSSSGPRSAIGDQLFSLMPHSDRRIPNLSGSRPPLLASRPAPLADAVFARLDNDAGLPTGDKFDKHEREKRENDAAEDSLDLWSRLHGLQ